MIFRASKKKPKRGQGLDMRRKSLYRGSSFEVSLTSMIDMFTIILVFLLKSYSLTDVSMSAAQDVKLPESTSERLVSISVTVSLSPNELKVDGETVARLQQGRLKPNDVQGLVIFPLFRELQAISKDKAALEKDTATQFDRRVILQGDREIPFSTLKRVLFTAGQAEYEAFRFTVMRKGAT